MHADSLLHHPHKPRQRARAHTIGLGRAQWTPRRGPIRAGGVGQAAGGRVSDVGRLTWYVKDKSEYLANQRAIGQAYQRIFGKHFPAMSLIIIDDLVEDEALLEIEATAFISLK